MSGSEEWFLIDPAKIAGLVLVLYIWLRVTLWFLRTLYRNMKRNGW